MQTYDKSKYLLTYDKRVQSKIHSLAGEHSSGPQASSHEGTNSALLRGRRRRHAARQPQRQRWLQLLPRQCELRLPQRRR